MSLPTGTTETVTERPADRPTPAAPSGTGDGSDARPAWTRLLHPVAWPWWVQVLVVYGIARLLSAGAFLLVAPHQAANGWTGEHPSYSDYVGKMFDATWYRQIAEHGYPSELPVDDAGRVQQNAWAFYPLYPLLCRLLMAVTGLGWTAVAPTLSLVLGAGAMLVLHRLVVVGAPRAVARFAGLPLATVLLLSVFPSAAVLQTAYTESLALLLVCGALLLLAQRRYLTAVPVVLLLGLTRAVALPLALVVLYHAAVRLRASARAEREGTVGDGVTLTVRDVTRISVLLVACVVAGVAWQIVAAVVTGRRDAYFATQAAWRAGGDVTFFEPWLNSARIIFGDSGPLALALVLVGVAALLACPAAFRLGPELQGWGVAYVLYLLAVTDPWTSTWRFLVLAFPLLAVLAQGGRTRFTRTAWLTVLVTLSLWGQLAWVWQLWRFRPPSDWAP